MTRREEYISKQYVLRVSRYRQVVWLTVDECIDGIVMPVLDYIEWPTQKKPWQKLWKKLEQDQPCIAADVVYSLVLEARAIFEYLRSNPLVSAGKVKKLKETFPKTEFRGNWRTRMNVHMGTRRVGGSFKEVLREAKEGLK